MKNTFIGIHMDFFGFFASAACAVHCAVIPFAVSLLPFLGVRFLDHHWLEYPVISISLLLAFLAISHGYTRYHRSLLPALVMLLGFILLVCGHFWVSGKLGVVMLPLGAILISAAHYINWKKISSSKMGLPGYGTT